MPFERHSPILRKGDVSLVLVKEDKPCYSGAPKNPPQTILTLSVEDLRDWSSGSRVSVAHVPEYGCDGVQVPG